MGKKAPDSGRQEDKPAEEPTPQKAASAAETKNSAKKMAKADEELSTSALSRMLQQRRRRPIFFVVHFVVCAWLLFVSGYSACDVKTSKREDCGYGGISTGECLSIACFIKDGAKFEKSVKLEKGAGLGLSVAENTDSSELTVTAVTGAAAEENLGGNRIIVGDGITKVGKETKLKMMKKALTETGQAQTLRIKRSKLPSYLRWISLGGKYTSYIELALASRWSRSFSYIGGCGFVCWALSGYPPTSLPLYYFGLSGATSFALHRCCYDDQVEGGIPHCYKGKSLNVEDAVVEAWTKTNKTVTKLYKDVAKDPVKYFKAFIPKF
ncbi:unnamed protein product [Prorocentrum cordatum]|uniref:PDZ domain-containing protein n=1 Tax=Prorocentrum cordatum TaxID=2364126 RepID=A0ABN9TRV9_9DINO|nr:unnamed protein product [Polarella glacialis]